MEQILTEAAALGVTVTVASGDNGSTDGVNDGKQHVDFPASAPHALACGGTTLQRERRRSASEIVWNERPKGGATGGGISIVFPRALVPGSDQDADQRDTGKAGRGVPDVAGDADPETGYQVLVDGQPTDDRRHERGGAAVGRPDRAAERVARQAGRASCSRRSTRLGGEPGSTTSPRATTARCRRAQRGMRAPGPA